MKNDTGMLNELWSRQIIKELIHHGVRTFCISPGSRSTPLTVAAAEHPLAETFIHYDERGTAFHALGVAKGNGRPVAVIVTSGTAAGNLLPAIMEASHDHLPLIILTADRPPEEIDSGANQTTDQVRMFANYVRWQGEFPCPDAKIPQSYVGTTVAQAISHALSEPKGPVHFNCPYRKPFIEIDEDSSSSFRTSQRLIHGAQTSISFGSSDIDEKTYEQITDELLEHERGLILVGGTVNIEDVENIYALSRALQWPILPDILSTVRAGGAGYGVIPHYDLILKAIGAHEDYAPDAILQLGDRFVSAKLTEWLAAKKPKVYCQVAPHMERKDPIHRITHRIITDPNRFVERLPKLISGRSPAKWLEAWRELNRLTKQGIGAYFEEYGNLTEPHLFYALKDIAPPSCSFFLGNGMPIRNGDAFFSADHLMGKAYGNRGLSGIDGNIATIAGLAKGLGKSVIGLIGDQTFLHDLNSLPQIAKLPVKLVVINNRGGDMSTFLPIMNRKDICETYFINPHEYSFEKAAALFNIPYEQPQTIENVAELFAEPGPFFIEIKTEGGGNLKIHQEILTNLKEIYSGLTTVF